MEAIKAENVVFSYKNSDGSSGEQVLNGVSLTVEKGTFTVIIGHNGSGKSTFARHFNGILLPELGRVHVFGMDTKDEKLLMEIRRRTGLVFQNPDNQIVANVVEEDVAFAPENLGCAPDEIRKRVDEALKTVGMDEYTMHAPHLLSGGQKQRIAIAGVLAMRPECVVFDEATAMLDPKGRQDVLEIIGLLKEKLGAAVVLITHHMEEAVKADKVVVMSDGRIVMEGKPEAVFSRVEELRSLSLDVPESVALIYELNKEGFDIPLENITEEKCAEAIYSALA